MIWRLFNSGFILKSSLLLVILTIIVSRPFAQVINPGHVGKLESREGAFPYLNLPFEAFVSGNFAFVIGNGSNNLEIIDIINPAAPLHKGSITLSGLPNCIFVQGNYAYIGLFGTSGLGAVEVINVSNPAIPTRASKLVDGAGGANLNNPISIFVVGNYAYVASQSGNALEILDVSNPIAPSHKATLLDGTGGAKLKSPVSVFVQGNFAYLTNYNAGVLEIVDITNPANPMHKGSISDGGGAAPYLRMASSVFVLGNYAYITTDFQAGLEIIDVTSPAAPVHKGFLRDGNGSAPYIQGFFTGSWSVYVQGNYAYIASGQDGDALEIVDVSNPALPVHKGSLKNGTGGAALSDAQSVFVSGNYAYVASSSSNALEVVDVSNPAAPTHASVVNSGTGGALLSSPVGVVVSGSYAYVAVRGSKALEIIDVSRPSTPVSAGNLIDGGGGAPYLAGIAALSVSGRYAYLVSYDPDNNVNGALEIVDVFNPANPVHKGSLTDGFGQAPYLYLPTSIAVSGNYAFITSQGTNRLEIVDVSNPALPVHVGSYGGGAPFGGPALSSPTCVFVSGNYAYITNSLGRSVIIVDVTTPSNPLYKGSILDGGGFVAPFLAAPKSIFVAGNYAYVTCTGINNALEIINISDPATPVHAGYIKGGVGNTPLFDNAFSVVVSGNYAYVASVKNKLIEVIDVSDASNPVHHASIADGTGGALLNSPQSIFVSGNYIYVASTFSSALEIIYLYSPLIYDFSPTTGAVGTEIILTGQNFNSLLKADFAGTPAITTGPITLISAKVIVPSGAKIGKLSFAVNGSPQPSVSNFLVIPTAFGPTDVQKNSLTINWSDVGAVEYKVDVSADGFNSFIGSFHNFSAGSSTSILLQGLQPGATYQYRVRSSDGAAISGNSNVVTFATLPSAPIAKSSDAISQVSFIARWASVPGATGYRLDVVATENSFSKNFLVGYNNLDLPDFSDTTQYVSGLSPYSNYYYRVRAYNSSGTSGSSNIIAVLTSDVINPVISPSTTPNPTTLLGGFSPTFNVNITDNVRVDSAMMFYRPIGKRAFESVRLQGPGGMGGNYSVVIQSTWLDALGMEYYFMAKDEAANKTVSDRSFVRLVSSSLSLPQLPSGSDQSNYRIISFPYRLATDNKVTTVYNGVPWNDNSRAAFWWWDPTMNGGSGAYDHFGSGTLETVEPGKGYWVLVKDPFTPQLPNITAPVYNRGNLFTMTLKPKWNQIGNPYPVSISWDNVMAYNQAINPGALFSSLSVFDGSGYQQSTGDKLLNPFEGGFVKNLGTSDITILIPFSDLTTSGGRVASPSDADRSGDNWSMDLHIAQGGFANRLGGFGMHRQAVEGEDRLDNFNPPGMVDGPEINFINPNLGSGVCKDIVPSYENYVWSFVSKGISGEAAQLRWNQNILTTSPKELFLLDEVRLKVINMNEVSLYEFTLTENARFRIFYGDHVESKITTQEIKIGQPFPNPVIKGQPTCLLVSLPGNNEEHFVTLNIFSAQNELMESVSRRISSGIHQLNLLEENESLSSGLYIYTLSITSRNASGFYSGKIVKP